MKIKQKLIHPRVINYVLHIERTLTFQFMSGQVAAFISAGSSCSPYLSGERRLLIFNYFSEVYMTTFPQLLLYNSAIQRVFPSAPHSLLPLFLSVREKEQHILTSFKFQHITAYLTWEGWSCSKLLPRGLWALHHPHLSLPVLWKQTWAAVES